jgi:hypothetical protein
MNTGLSDSGYVPTTSPYSDAREVSTVPENVVDWVLVKLRTEADSEPISQKSFFLRKDGQVVDVDGTTTELEMPNAPDGDYFVVVRHRNHLAVMSGQKVENLSD